MAAVKGDKEYSIPILGINTEADKLHFPLQYAADVLNMEIDYNPLTIRPRKGMKEGASTMKHVAETRTINDYNIASSFHLWENADRDSNLNFLVVQVGKRLWFFNTADITDSDNGVHSETVNLSDLSSGTTKGTTALIESKPVVTTNIKGNLLLTQEGIDPTVLQWDSGTSTITITKLSLKIRDTLGIEDDLDIDERPASLSDDHKYNLYNQGWHQQRRIVAAGADRRDRQQNRQHYRKGRKKCGVTH